MGFEYFPHVKHSLACALADIANQTQHAFPQNWQEILLESHNQSISKAQGCTPSHCPGLKCTQISSYTKQWASGQTQWADPNPHCLSTHLSWPGDWGKSLDCNPHPLPRLPTRTRRVWLEARTGPGSGELLQRSRKLAARRALMAGQASVCPCFVMSSPPSAWPRCD